MESVANLVTSYKISGYYRGFVVSAFIGALAILRNEDLS